MIRVCTWRDAPDAQGNDFVDINGVEVGRERHARGENKVAQAIKDVTLRRAALARYERGMASLSQTFRQSIGDKAYQVEGIQWMCAQELNKERLSGCTFDQPGLGKTLQTLTMMASDTQRNLLTLVIAPKSSIKSVWHDEINEPVNGFRQAVTQTEVDYAMVNCTREEEKRIEWHDQFPDEQSFSNMYNKGVSNAFKDRYGRFLLISRPDGKYWKQYGRVAKFNAQGLATFGQVFVYSSDERSDVALNGKLDDWRQMAKGAPGRRGVVITNFAFVRNQGRLSMLQSIKWDRVVVDEVHKMNNTEGATFKSVDTLISTHRWGLTGTPANNRISDFFAIMRFLRIAPYASRGWFDYYFDFSVKTKLSELTRLALQEGQIALDDVNDDISVDDVNDDISVDNVNADEELMFKKEQEAAARDERNREKATVDAQQISRFDDYRVQVLREISIRRLKDVVLRGGIKVTNFNEPLSWGPDDLAYRVYKAIEEAFKNWINEVVQNVALATSKKNFPVYSSFLNALRRCCNHPALAIGETPGALKISRELISKKWTAWKNEHTAKQVADATKDNLPADTLAFDLTWVDENEWRQSPKLTQLVAEAKRIRDNGEKLVVFSNWTTVTDGMERAFKAERLPYAIVTGKRQRVFWLPDALGSLVEMKKPELRENFSNDPSIPATDLTDEVVKAFRSERVGLTVILLTYQKGAEALNLQVANNMVLNDPWFNPAKEEQAKDRIYRVNQQRDIFIWRYAMEESVEVSIMGKIKAEKDAMKSRIESSPEADLFSPLRFSEITRENKEVEVLAGITNLDAQIAAVKARINVTEGELLVPSTQNEINTLNARLDAEREELRVLEAYRQETG
jgi:SNF2 family DNA or RNA helicase